MIYTLLSKYVASRISALLWAKFAMMPELGDGGSNQFWQCQHFGNIWSPNPSLSTIILHLIGVLIGGNYHFLCQRPLFPWLPTYFKGFFVPHSTRLEIDKHVVIEIAVEGN